MLVEHRPRVIIFRASLLAPSETFIRDQGESLRAFEPWYAGCRRVAGVSLPIERTAVLDRGGVGGRVRDIGFKASGVAPGFRRRLAALEPVLVHAHFGPDAALIMPLARRLGVPLVATFHGYDATMADQAARHSFFLHRRYLERRATLQRDGRLFLAVSRFVRDRLLAQGYPADRTVVHYAGLRLEVFHPDRAVVREPLVLFVGRLAPEKGCLDLIGAMRRVQDVYPEAGLVVLGAGPLGPWLERLARGVGVRCRFLGSVSQEDVVHWMARAQVLCAPSVTLPTDEAEGFGLACAEAQAMALPVVATRVGGIPEVVADGESGLLVRERDQAALADCIVRLLRDPGLRERMGDAGRRRVERCFDGGTQARVLEGLYARALA
jgi:glycosyltransferase involved in cell wall biosynthesis